MKTEKFYIDGMTCSACSSGIERSLKRKDFIHSIEVNLVNQSAIVSFDENKSNLESIFALVEKLGYAPHQFSTQNSNEMPLKELIKQKNWVAIEKKLLPSNLRLTIAVIMMFIVLYLSMVGMFFPSIVPPILQSSLGVFLQIIATGVTMLLGWRFYTKGFKSIVSKNPNMDSLIAISTTAALFYSFYLISTNSLTHGLYFESITVILTLVMVGKHIEEGAKNNANSAISALLAKQSKEVILIDGTTERTVLIDHIKINDHLKILPGHSIPVDGILFEGEGYLDESMLTGEIMPIFKQKGDKLFAGSLNTQTSFILKATSDSQHNTLQAMIALIEEAANSKTKMTKIADKVAMFFVPSVIFIALLAGIFWSFYQNFTFGFEIFIAVLVISCPCALGLATPMAVMIASAIANKKGLFFKNVQSMEYAGQVSAVVFDKTGTLTYTHLKIAHIIPLKGNEETLLQIAASIEQGSEHLIAKAILKECKVRQLELLKAEKFCTKSGYGICASIHNQEYTLGNAELFSSESLKPLQEKMRDIENFIHVIIGQGEEVLGAILLEDFIKEGAKELIETLKTRKIKSYILSGDRENNVKRVAENIGIVEFIAKAKPQDKLEFVKHLKAQGEVVMMVGDGINDVAALEASDVSVSFSSASDISTQSAEILICNEDIRLCGFIIALSKATSTNIKQNLFWAFCYNVISIPLACGFLYGYGILLNPMIAAAAMSFSSLSVVLNAQRLRGFKFIKE
ncbi:hypothetical protein CCZ01_06505 [Helicobacter monodelphidis]|uniref:heavy metal translocating P-type ATPase n=1 Tax=Helicobacter sp. 15-1451 TaxID=2004995 RepID=UPI000DCE773F|nr:heavy metal translocating P-type ATPase [Helicobacter sp. 15-1451]RAX57343.1 hypothetical protein CCZ01_06505 [Helicobacter sp. 15-1451]